MKITLSLGLAPGLRLRLAPGLRLALALTLTLILSPLSFARESTRGNEGPGGGDEIALEFKLAFASALGRIQERLPELHQKIRAAELEKVLQNAEILVVNTSLAAERDGIYQDSIAINYRESQRILINRYRWREVTQNEIREALALHEVASLGGFESTGKYPWSGKYLTLFSLYVNPEYDFTPACGRIETILYKRAVSTLEVGESTLTEMESAAVATLEKLRECGSLKQSLYCEAILPKLEFLVAATKELVEAEQKTKYELALMVGRLKNTRENCASDRTD